VRFDARALHAAVDRQRRFRGVSWEQLARDIGVSRHTLHALGRGREPTVRVLALVLPGLGLRFEDFLKEE